MNLSKSAEFFDPSKVKSKIHIIGCGSVGSTLAENLVRCGLTNIVLYDFDKVEQHNIVNQLFDERHVGMNKAEATLEILKDINPEVSKKVKLYTEGWNGEMLQGFIFLCVDNIELRRTIVEKHMNNPMVKGVFDFRTLLEGAQHYAADWTDKSHRDNLLATMQFSHEEAAAETPVSACGITLGVCYTVKSIVAIGVANFINFVKGNGIKKMVLLDLSPQGFCLDAF